MKRDRDLACLQLETLKEKYPHEFAQNKKSEEDEQVTGIDLG